MSRQTTATDVLIVGGGVVGLSLAWELSRRGRTVEVVERGVAGRAASWAGAGILPPARADSALHPVERLRGIANRLHPQWAAELREETGIDTGFRQCGGLYVARTAGEMASLSGLQALFAEEQVTYRMLDPQECLAFAPKLDADPAMKAAIWTPDEWQLRNPWHLRALRAACERRGVRIWEHEPITSWDRSGSRIVAARSPHGRWAAEQVCVTAGAWTHLLMDDLGFPNGIFPMRGQMVLFHPRETLTSCIVNEGTRYVVPRDDGRLLVGSTEEEVGFCAETTRDAIDELVRFAVSLFPALASETIEAQWAGLRPATFDGLPYMGQLPGLDNAFVAAGHFRSGLSLSPAIATLIAGLMAGEAVEADLAAFRVDRLQPQS